MKLATHLPLYSVAQYGGNRAAIIQKSYEGWNKYDPFNFLNIDAHDKFSLKDL